MISTPEGYNWLYKKWRQGKTQEGRADGWDCTRFKSADNPHLDPSFIESKRSGPNSVSPDIFRQEYEASFEHHSGLVWKEYEDKYYPHGHLFSDGDFDLHGLSHYRAIDPGLRNPTACLWACVDEEGNVFIYDEYQQEDTLIQTHATNIKIQTKNPVEVTYIDPEAKKRGRVSGRTILETYSENGIYAAPADNTLEAGIATVSRYLRSTLEDAPTHPRVFIHERCGMLQEQLNNYVWHELQTVEEKNQPDKPRKYNDHLCDAFRYLLSMKPTMISHKRAKMQKMRERKREAMQRAGRLRRR